MFTRRVRWQLGIFGALTLLSIFLIARDYLRVQDMAGIGLQRATIEFSDASGLYEGGLVTYRGVKVGKIEQVRLGVGDRGAEVVVHLEADRRIPASVMAEAHSSSAIGENYIDLVPASGEGPWLRDGSVIPAAQSQGLQPTGELLESLNAAMASVPKKATDTLLTEVAAAFTGTSQDFSRLVSTAGTLTQETNENLPAIRSLLDGLPDFLGTAGSVAPDVRRSLAGLAATTTQLDESRNDVNALVREVPSLGDSVQGLVTDVESDVPILLANLLSTGQVAKVYLPGLEQILVVYPGVMGAVQSAATGFGAPQSIMLGARLTVNQPPNCYSGFLPYKDQRDFNDESRRKDVPDDLYCKVPHNDPRAVRGARNTPCLNAPGVRAASVEECLGHKIGTISDPLGRARPVATYDPQNGRSLAQNGQLFTLGGVGEPSKEQTWQDLLLK
ncbi:MAG TPA: MlaD family protein [Nocardioidaceae bacterium]|nr:MlaD family protein [Nocardioidaceae bacterium]